MGHAELTAPLPWIKRFAPLVPPGGTVLDVAAGGGRHSAFFSERGHPVSAVDRDTTALRRLENPRLTVLEQDLEDSSPWPFQGSSFSGVVVTHYLWRPRLQDILTSVAPGGALLYETFGAGNEIFGKPSRPDFLLQPGELLRAVGDAFHVVAYECGLDRTGETPAIKQRIAAVRSAGPVGALEGEWPVVG